MLTLRFWASRHLGFRLRLRPGCYETDGKKLRKVRDFNERATAIVAEATITIEDPLDSLVVVGAIFEEERPLRIPTNLTGIKIVDNKLGQSRE